MTDAVLIPHPDLIRAIWDSCPEPVRAEQFFQRYMPIWLVVRSKQDVKRHQTPAGAIALKVCELSVETRVDIHCTAESRYR